MSGAYQHKIIKLKIKNRDLIISFVNQAQRTQCNIYQNKNKSDEFEFNSVQMFYSTHRENLTRYVGKLITTRYRGNDLV